MEFSNVIRADGSWFFPPVARAGRKVVVEVKGTFGGGTVRPGYDDGAGNFVAFLDGNGTAISCTSAAGWTFVVPASGRLAVQVSGSANPALSVGATKVPF